MTAKEAIEILKANYPDTCSSQLKEAVHKAIEALRDALPKKPIEDEGNRTTVFKCPRCHSAIAYKFNEINDSFVFSTLLKNNICSCGQEIDWSEEEE